MKLGKINVNPLYIPVLDTNYKPAILANRAFRKAVGESGKSVLLRIAVERGDGLISTYDTEVFEEGTGMDNENFFYTERLVKTLLWIHGGWKVIIGGPASIGEYIRKVYTPEGIREFDANFMSRVYERPFVVEVTDAENVPLSREEAKPIGRHLEGCRIGFDAGGSDRKVAAVIDGKPVYSEEVIWHPKIETNPEYHFEEIYTAIKTAAAYLPKVDAMVSVPQVYI